jgi:hypothetical protein
MESFEVKGSGEDGELSGVVWLARTWDDGEHENFGYDEHKLQTPGT